MSLASRHPHQCLTWMVPFCLPFTVLTNDRLHMLRLLFSQFPLLYRLAFCKLIIIRDADIAPSKRFCLCFGNRYVLLDFPPPHSLLKRHYCSPPYSAAPLPPQKLHSALQPSTLQQHIMSAANACFLYFILHFPPPWIKSSLLLM